MASEDALSVLLVEDEATDRWFFAEVLRARGHTVTACETGEAAAEALEGGLPDLVVLDLILPGIDGLELLRRMRGQPRGSEPFVLVVTARDDPAALEQALEAGADDFVNKPVAPATLSIRLAVAEQRIQGNRELRHAQAELARKTREIETLFQNAHDVFFSVDVSARRLIQISPSARDVFGHEPEELLQDESLWRRFILPGTGESDAWAGLQDGVDRGPVVVEYPVARADGARRWLRASVRAQRDVARDGLRADGVVADVTREQEARAELAERNRELAALYQLAELTLHAGSEEQPYEEIIGLVADVTGAPVVAIEHLDRDHDRLVMIAGRGIPALADGPVDAGLHQTLSGIAVKSGKPVTVHEPQQRREHAHDALERLDLKSYAAFPLSAGGSVFGTLMLADREPMRFDDRFVRLGSNLATTVATWVERIEAENALRESEARHRALADQLQQANQELESFAYSVSHDLRAPLRTMQGFAHALLQNHGATMPDEAADYARRIIASGQQSERLISDLLAYSRLSFERLELKPVDLDGVVKAALEQVQGDIDEAGARVQVGKPLPSVRGNHTTLVQVVANLVSNAIKFVPGGRTPEVEVFAEDREPVVRLWVKDNGIGIPQGQEERIFRVFERLTEGSDRPGTGIGLAIVRRGLERIEGHCGVERRPEGGSAFWIDVPRERRRTWRRWRRGS